MSRISHSSVVAFFGLLALLVAVPCSRAQGLGDDASAADLHELYYGAHLPHDRVGSQAIELAQELVAQKRFSESIPLLLDTLAKPEDGLEHPGGSGDKMPRSLRVQARALIDSLPAAGMRAYRLAVDSKSRRLLRQAVQVGNLAAAREVARLYPNSNGAAGALWFVANAAFDQGDYQSAITALKRLGGNVNAEQFEPQRSLLEAAAFLGHGDRVGAEELIQKLSESSWRSSKAIEGVSISDPDRLLSWLEGMLQTSPTPQAALAGLRRAWPVSGGGRDRNPLRLAEPPHPWARWTALTTVDPRVEETLTAFSNDLRQNNRSMVPVCQPIAVGDWLFVRTADNLVALDWESGRRVWQTRPETRKRTRSAVPSGWTHYTAEQSEATRWSRDAVRTWYDSIISSVSSDGRNVYVVEPIDERSPNVEGWDSFAWQRSRFETPLGPLANRLSAYSLATEGKLAWTLGDRPESPLAGAFFLGAPQPTAEGLMVLAEVDQTICLLQLDPETAEVEWRQPLVSVEMSVQQSSMRRLVGGATAQSGRYIICSTGAGVVMAVDPIQRAIVWADRFPVSASRRTSNPSPWRNRSREVWVTNSHKTWLENRVVIAGDRVVVASPESPMLHCLDLGTGEPHWRAKRGSGALLSAVVGQVVLVGGADYLQGFDLDSGDKLWRYELTAGEVLSGRCLAIGDRVLVPISSGTIEVIDLETGESDVRLRCWGGGGVGNLILHRGTLLSQTPTTIDRFDQNDILLASARRRLKSNPQDVSARCLLGESELSEGRLDGAIEQFLAAYQADPASSLARSRLRRAVGIRLGQAGPNAGDLALLEDLVETPSQRMALKVQAIELAVADMELERAVQLALRLPELPLEAEPMVVWGEGKYAAPYRRVSALLGKAWSEADEAERQRAASTLRQASANVATTYQSGRFFALFHRLPLGGEIRQAYFATLQQENRELEFALHAAERFAGSAVTPFATGAPIERDPRWATRQVVARQAAQQDRFGRRGGRTAGWRRVELRQETKSSPLAVEREQLFGLAVDTDNAELVGADQNGVEVFRSRLAGSAAGFLRRIRFEAGSKVWQYGPCLFLSAGENVVALEALPGGDARDRRLWSTEGLIQSITTRARRIEDWPLSPHEDRLAPDPASPASVVGVTSRGVVIHKGGSLLCVDALSGALQWLRSDREFAEGVIVGADHVFAVTDDKQAVRLALEDGSDAGEWQLPRGEWLDTRNGRLTTARRIGKSVEIKTVDVASNEELLTSTLSVPYQLTKLGGPGLAVLDSEGRFELIDTSAGVRVAEATLPLRGDPEGLVVAVRRGRAIVGVAFSPSARTRSARVSPLDAGDPLGDDFSGDVFCLDLQTESLVWDRPLEVIGRSWLLRQPRDCPLLVFGSRQEQRNSGRPVVLTRLLVVDALSGRTVYRNDGLDDDAVNAYQIEYLEGEAPQLRLKLPKSQITLSLTEQVGPPGPPTTDSVETAQGGAPVGAFARQIKKVWGGAIQAKPAGNAGGD